MCVTNESRLPFARFVNGHQLDAHTTSLQHGRENSTPHLSRSARPQAVPVGPARALPAGRRTTGAPDYTARRRKCPRGPLVMMMPLPRIVPAPRLRRFIRLLARAARFPPRCGPHTHTLGRASSSSSSGKFSPPASSLLARDVGAAAEAGKTAESAQRGN